METTGLSKSLLRDPNNKIPHLQGRVIPALQHALSQIDGEILLDDPYICPPLQENDVAIMEIALEGNYTDTQIEQINVVKERLGVLYLSEIATIDGKFIQRQILTDQQEYLYRSTRKRVIQAMPNKRSWDLFKKVIESVCMLASNLSNR